jgi:hypothetical protein
LGETLLIAKGERKAAKDAEKKQLRRADVH